MAMEQSYLFTLTWSFTRPTYIQKNVRKTIELCDGTICGDFGFDEFGDKDEIFVKGTTKYTKYENKKALLEDLKTKTIDDFVNCAFYQECTDEGDEGEILLEISRYELTQNKPKLLELDIYNEKRNCLVNKAYFSFANLVKTIENTTGARYYINGLDITKFVKNGWLDAIYVHVNESSALICIEDPIEK